MFLEYLSLAILLIGLLMLFYAFIYLHNLPYAIAKKRNHPQVEAIHVACWLSLVTFHAIWPIVFIWAVANRDPNNEAGVGPGESELKDRINRLENRLSQLEKPASPLPKAAP